MCTLELSKVLGYEFRCDYVRKKCHNKSRFLFPLTDSLVYEIETENVYDDFSKN